MTFTFTELSNTMRYLGIKMKSDEIDKMLKDFDEDGSGQIEFNEFAILMEKMVKFISSVSKSNFLTLKWSMDLVLTW